MTKLSFLLASFRSVSNHFFVFVLAFAELFVYLVDGVNSWLFLFFAHFELVYWWECCFFVWFLHLLVLRF